MRRPSGHRVLAVPGRRSRNGGTGAHVYQRLRIGSGVRRATVSVSGSPYRAARRPPSRQPRSTSDGGAQRVLIRRRDWRARPFVAWCLFNRLPRTVGREPRTVSRDRLGFHWRARSRKCGSIKPRHSPAGHTRPRHRWTAWPRHASNAQARRCHLGAVSTRRGCASLVGHTRPRHWGADWARCASIGHICSRHWAGGSPRRACDQCARPRLR